MGTTRTIRATAILLATHWTILGQSACIETQADSHLEPDAAPIAIDAGAERPPSGESLWLPDCGALRASIEQMYEQRRLAAVDGGSTNASITGDAAVPAIEIASHEAPAATNESAAPVAAGAVVISEIMADPRALADTAGEWIELHNPGPDPIDLQGCSIDDGGTQRPITEPLRIAPQQVVTIARTSSPGFVPDAVLALSLTNTSDAIALRCDGVEVDRVVYDASFPLAAGASMALDPRALDADANDDASAWCLATQAYGPDLGTPGEPNPGCFDDAGVD